MTYLLRLKYDGILKNGAIKLKDGCKSTIQYNKSSPYEWYTFQSLPKLCNSLDRSVLFIANLPRYRRIQLFMEWHEDGCKHQNKHTCIFLMDLWLDILYT